jgi:hypothetical protein
MLIPAQNSNKANYKIQDCFANRQTKEDVKCNNLLLQSICKNMHACIDITFDVDFTKNFSPFLEIGQNGAYKEFISI